MMITDDNGIIECRGLEYLATCGLCEEKAVYELNEIDDEGIFTCNLCYTHFQLFVAEYEDRIEKVERYEGERGTLDE